MSLNKIKFSTEKTNYIAPTWERMNDLAFIIAQKMIEDGTKFDRIITLAKGGWPMARSLVDFLHVPKVASVGVKFYSGINERLTEPEIYQDLPISVTGEAVLLFDDVADTGTSLEFVTNYLKNRGVKEVVTATLFYKPHSTIKPDYYGTETSAWIIFPYDVVEAIDVLGQKWRQAGIGEREIKSRFQELGFKKEWVEYFLVKE